MRWCNTSSVGDMLDELQWPSIEVPMYQSSTIHDSTTSVIVELCLLIIKSRLLDPRSLHNSQYCKPQTYSELVMP